MHKERFVGSYSIIWNKHALKIFVHIGCELAKKSTNIFYVPSPLRYVK